MDPKSFPAIPADLLKKLNEMHPERTPTLTDSVDLIRFKSGERSVVQFLNAMFIAQNETVIKPSP